MKLKFPQLTEQNFKEAFNLIRAASCVSSTTSYSTQFGTLHLGDDLCTLAQSATVTKSGKLDVRYQLSSEGKKLLKAVIKNIPSLDKDARKPMSIALRALIVKCVALDTPELKSAEPKPRKTEMTIKVGK